MGADAVGAGFPAAGAVAEGAALVVGVLGEPALVAVATVPALLTAVVCFWLVDVITLVLVELEAG